MKRCPPLLLVLSGLAAPAAAVLAADKPPADKPATPAAAADPTAADKLGNWSYWRGPDQNGVARARPARHVRPEQRRPKAIWSGAPPTAA